MHQCGRQVIHIDVHSVCTGLNPSTSALTQDDFQHFTNLFQVFAKIMQDFFLGGQGAVGILPPLEFFCPPLESVDY